MENQKRFSVMLVSGDAINAFLTNCLLEESNLFNRPPVFQDVDRTLQYVQENCLDFVPAKRIPIPRILLIDNNMPSKDGTVRRRG